MLTARLVHLLALGLFDLFLRPSTPNLACTEQLRLAPHPPSFSLHAHLHQTPRLWFLLHRACFLRQLDGTGHHVVLELHSRRRRDELNNDARVEAEVDALEGYSSGTLWRVLGGWLAAETLPVSEWDVKGRCRGCEGREVE